MGVCPQHNTLFEGLTVEQHLVFFSRLKGTEGDLEGEIKQILDAFGLQEKRHTASSSLSGGQKRKLRYALWVVKI